MGIVLEECEMGFVANAAKAVISPFTSGKKKPGEIPALPTMISTSSPARPISMIGTRGGR